MKTASNNCFSRSLWICFWEVKPDLWAAWKHQFFSGNLGVCSSDTAGSSRTEKCSNTRWFFIFVKDLLTVQYTSYISPFVTSPPQQIAFIIQCSFKWNQSCLIRQRTLVFVVLSCDFPTSQKMHLHYTYTWTGNWKKKQTWKTFYTFMRWFLRCVDTEIIAEV